MLPVLVVAVLLAAELGTRAIEDHLPPDLGPQQEIFVKVAQIRSSAYRDGGDLVFVGPSTTDAGIDPEIFDAASDRFSASYNAGLKGLTIDMFAPWLDDNVLPRLRPDVVVIDIQPTLIQKALGRAAVEVERYRAAYRVALRRASATPLARLDRRIGRSVALVRNRGTLQDPSALVGAIRGTVTGADPPSVIPEDTAAFARANTSPQGRVLQYRTSPDEVVGDPAAVGLLKEYLSNDVQTAEAESLVRSLERRGYEVVVTILPIDIPTLTRFGLVPGTFAPADRAIEELTAELGVPLLNYRDLELEPLMYHDKVHLADRGAEAVSKRLATDIDALCDRGVITRCPI